MDEARKLQVLQVALMLGKVEDVQANIKKVLEILETPALWPPVPPAPPAPKQFFGTIPIGGI